MTLTAEEWATLRAAVWTAIEVYRERVIENQKKGEDVHNQDNWGSAAIYSMFAKVNKDAEQRTKVLADKLMREEEKGSW